MQFKDYYAILGVSREATPAEIKKAYRRLAREHHPDRATEARRASAEERIKEINEAYEVLKDPAKRQRYDQLGAQWNAPPPAAGGRGDFSGFGGRGGFGGGGVHFGGTGFSDFFEQFFGAGGGAFAEHGAAGFGARKAPARQDLEADLMVELEEVLHGATRPLSLRTPTAAGSAGQAPIEFKVRVPPGVREGQRLRVRGRAPAASLGGTPGDILLRVRIAPHPFLRREGQDLMYELELAPWQLVLGDRVSVPTLDGEVRLKVPPGTPAGRRFRVRGRGLPGSDSTARGDLLIEAGVTIPSTLSPEERAAWEQLANLSPPEANP